MKADDVAKALELLKQSDAQAIESMATGFDQYLNAADRVIAQAAQLKLMSEPDPLDGTLLAALQEAAKSENPL